MEEKNISSDIIWEAQEKEFLPKTNRWYLIAYLILVAAVIWALITNNFLMAILVILIGFSGYLFHEKTARFFKFGIFQQGVLIHDILYEYAFLDSFWIFEDFENKKILSLKSKKFFLPFIRLPLGTTDPNIVREKLLEFIPEQKQSTSFVDFIENLF